MKSNMNKIFFGTSVHRWNDNRIFYKQAVSLAKKYNVELHAPSNFNKKQPVIAIMGHVDHGKTSLLDVIRNTNIVTNEFGGITQHISCYHHNISNKSGN